MLEVRYGPELPHRRREERPFNLARGRVGSVGEGGASGDVRSTLGTVVDSEMLAAPE
jgi:hypothetical protein